MTGRRKGTPCACETDPCGCGSSKGKCVRAVNNVSPDPNGDLVIRGGVGIEIIQSGDDLVINNTTNPNTFIAGNNIELNPSGDDISIDLVNEPVVDGLTVNGDTQLNGDVEVNGDIIQNGAAYETHAEHIYSRDDFIIMRDGAIAALAPGDYAGFKVKLYDGVNDGALVIDSSGTARVGDVGDEQPLLTRDEAADLTDGDSLIWDAANSKAITENRNTGNIVSSSFTANQHASTPGEQILLSFLAPTIDSNFYEAVDSNTAITIKKNGVYDVKMIIDMSSGMGTGYILFIYINGSIKALYRKIAQENDDTTELTYSFKAQANDKIQFKVSMGNTTMKNNGTWSIFQITYLGKGI